MSMFFLCRDPKALRVSNQVPSPGETARATAILFSGRRFCELLKKWSDSEQNPQRTAG